MEKEDISREFEIYSLYRKAQASLANRPYKLPKDWESHWNTKLKSEEREIIRKMKRHLLTIWQNIDLYEYFKCGFEIWKGFSYAKWFDQKIIKLYIAKDTNKKRNLEVDKKRIVESAKFIKAYMKENDIETLWKYAHLRDGFKSIPIEHYLMNKIDPGIIVYLVYKKYLNLDDNDRASIPRIVSEFREIRYKMLGIIDFFENIEKNLML